VGRSFNATVPVRITGVSTDAIASMLISSVTGRQTVTVMVLGPCLSVG
jgi:uncharacterized membrane protein